MTIDEERTDPLVQKAREHYNVPPATPRNEMWGAISARIAEEPGQVIDITGARARRAGLGGRRMGWAVAAAAVLVLGLGIGRMTAPTGLEVGGVATRVAAPAALSLAAQEHFGRTESLLTMVRADARMGRLDPDTGVWAGGLLSQTRLLIDAHAGGDETMRELLLDLELVLVQIVGVVETGPADAAKERMELDLAVRTIQEGEVLSRIHAALPVGFAGT